MDFDSRSVPLKKQSIQNMAFLLRELSVNYHDEFLTDVEKFYSADVLICKPERFLEDRVLCENRAIWKKPMYTLKYDCSSAPSASKLGDGRCDIENNIEDCFDMGDCCESTCALCPGEPEVSNLFSIQNIRSIYSRQF